MKKPLIHNKNFKAFYTSPDALGRGTKSRNNAVSKARNRRFRLLMYEILATIFTENRLLRQHRAGNANSPS